MFIEPNTNIKILKNVPLDNSYKNTLFFHDVTYQYNYFNNMAKHTLLEQTYQRVEKGKMRVQLKAEALYDCNYLMFQNGAFASKWFYAFITGVEYINNIVSEITYEIDVMQTWYFDYTLKECFVEREHSVTDEIGENLVVEPIDTGDIICGQCSGTGMFDSYVAVIATTLDVDDEKPGGVVGGLFTGLNYYAGLIDNEEQVNNLLDLLQSMTSANQQDSIVNIFFMPTKFYTDKKEPVVEVVKVAKNSMLGDYVPRNKKLLTFPYNYLGVDCGNNGCVFRYEYFNTDDNTCQFTMSSAVSSNPEIGLIPVDYNGSEFNYIEKLVMKGFPQIGYAIDSYRAWLAQEATGQFYGLLGTGASLGIGLGLTATGNPMGLSMVASGVLGSASTLNSMIISANRPPQARGNDGGTLDVALRTKDFWFRQMHITPQYAKIIDDYFDMYGYATQRTKIPNISSRPHWNYVKTNNCIIVGSLPADDIKSICGIYDKGITFWKLGEEVGDYSLDNSPQVLPG